MGISFLWTRYLDPPGEGVDGVYEFGENMNAYCWEGGRCHECRHAGDPPYATINSRLGFPLQPRLGLTHGCCSDLAPYLGKALRNYRTTSIRSPELRNLSLRQRKAFSTIMASVCLMVVANVLDDKDTKCQATLVYDYLMRMYAWVLDRTSRYHPLLDHVERDRLNFCNHRVSMCVLLELDDTNLDNVFPDE